MKTHTSRVQHLSFLVSDLVTGEFISAEQDDSRQKQHRRHSPRILNSEAEAGHLLTDTSEGNTCALFVYFRLNGSSFPLVTGGSA